jgi:hypothetical protein
MHHAYMIKITYTPPIYATLTLTASKNMLSTLYAMLLHWELVHICLFTSLETYLFTSPQNKDSMYSRSLSILHTSLKKRHGLYVMKKEKVEKKWVGKDDKKRELSKKVLSKKKRMSIKDSPWSQSSRFGERNFKESTFHSYPYTCTLDHVCVLFSSMDPYFDFTI